MMHTRCSNFGPPFHLLNPRCTKADKAVCVYFLEIKTNHGYRHLPNFLRLQKFSYFDERIPEIFFHLNLVPCSVCNTFYSIRAVKSTLAYLN